MLPPCSVTLPGNRAAFSIEGSGHPVVLLHSSTGADNPRAWAEGLRNSHRLIAIDLQAPAATTESTAAIELVESVLRVGLLPGERFHLVGQSHGAALALRMAQARPHRLRSLTLLEPQAHMTRPDRVGAVIAGLIRGLDTLDLQVPTRVAVHG